jgi:hypothetical protein
VDILQSIDGLDFPTVYTGSIEYLIDDEVPARYISADDLITNKLASGRPQDLADVAAIRQARAALEKNRNRI